MMTESSTISPIHDESTVKSLKPKGLPTLQKRGSTLTIILKPHNTSLQTRTLELKDKIKIRIGRQTSTKTSPTAFNGYFDSKVLSRQHAEIWSDKSKVYIKDVKSSNGTFVNGERLSNECEESEPKELNNHDEVEFGIDIINDNGSVMYHKVSCSVHIFPVPLAQVDDSIIKELSNSHYVQVYPDPHLLTRKSSTSSINTLSPDMSNASSTTTGASGIGATNTNTTTVGKRSKKLESVLSKLQAEIDKSKQVENELKTIKETAMDLDKLFSDDKIRKSDELQMKLNQAEAKIKSYDDKWKYQNQAIQTAKQELHKLEKEQEGYNGWSSERAGLMHALQEEKQKAKDLQDRINELSRQHSSQNGFLDAIQIKSVQYIFAVLIGVISTLVYVLCN